MLRTLSHRARVTAVVAATAALAAVPMVGTFADESSSDVKNPECTDLGYATDVKFDPPAPGTYTRDGVTYSWTIQDTSAGPELSWTSSVPVFGLIAKGGQGGYLLFDYPGGATSGSGVHTPLNPSGTWAGFSHINFCGAVGGETTTTVPETTTTMVVPPLEPLSVSLDAAGSYTKTFEWSIAKSADVAWIARAGSSAPITYDVAVDRTGYHLSDQLLAGTVTITNPNATDVEITSVDVDGADCTLDAPNEVAPGSTTVDVTCDVSGVTTSGAFPRFLDASIEWDDPSPLASVFSAGVADVRAALDVTKVNATVSVVDSFDGGPGVAIAAGPYSVSAATPATQSCRSVNNVATIVETGQSSSAAVTVCRQAQTKGGFTIGFWQNKNGQAKITSELCGPLAAYASAWAGSGFPTGSACTTSSLQSWATSVFKSANAKDHVQMLRAQMMGTALSMLTDGSTNHLGETDVPVGSSCQTVSALLSSTSSGWSALTADRAASLTIKDIFDRINNNVQAVCP